MVLRTHAGTFSDDVNRSGIWPQARKIAHDEEKLKDVAYQAHKLITPGRFEITKARVVGKVLVFSDGQYKPVYADMIEYWVFHEPETSYHVTKGLRSDCVFHLWLVAWDEREEFELNGQVCTLYILSKICP